MNKKIILVFLFVFSFSVSARILMPDTLFSLTGRTSGPGNQQIGIGVGWDIENTISGTKRWWDESLSVSGAYSFGVGRRFDVGLFLTYTHGLVMSGFLVGKYNLLSRGNYHIGLKANAGIMFMGILGGAYNASLIFSREFKFTRFNDEVALDLGLDPTTKFLHDIGKDSFTELLKHFVRVGVSGSREWKPGVVSASSLSFQPYNTMNLVFSVEQHYSF